MKSSTTLHDYSVRPVQEKDNPVIAQIIISVLKEHGAEGEGYAGADPETQVIYQTYRPEGSAYYVVTDAEGAVLGGAGFSPLKGGDGTVCEFQKMYLKAEGRGKGLGKLLLDRCLQEAKEYGYKQCYIETLSNMDAAQALYLKAGFRRIDEAMGDTGHFKIDRYFIKEL